MTFYLKRYILLIFLAGSISSVVWGGDRAELARLRAENRRLRLEADRLRSELSKRDNDLLKFRHWLAAASDSGKMMRVSERELQLTGILKEIVTRSNRLLTHISGVDSTFRDLLKELPVGPARQARLTLLLDQMERYAMQLSSIAGVYEESSDRRILEDVRVVSVNRELDTVILSAGSVHGVFPGLLFLGKNDSRLRLRVTAVRPWVCAAVPVSGSTEKMSPGMRFTVAHQAAPGEGIQPLRTR